jgi:hypothetical protein
VLSEKMRNGDFSEVSTQIVNPVTKVPYAGNIIPRSQLSSQALAALQYMPLPTGSGVLNNYVTNVPTRTTRTSISAGSITLSVSVIVSSSAML